MTLDDEAFARAHVGKYASLIEADTGALPISPGSQWWKAVPKLPGVYGIFERGTLVYFGETADLRERMHDLEDTRHHTLRRHVGKREFSNHPEYRRASSREKFPELLERELDRRMSNFTVKVIPVALGRKEIEGYVIESKRPLFNKPPRRGVPLR